MKFALLVAAFTLLSCSQLFAWSSGGHMVIAAEAFKELSPELKVNVTKILESHPNYSEWKSSYEQSVKSLDLALYVFMRASTWPDEIRRKNNQYDHPHWHYIDYPLKPPNFPMEPEPSPNDDVLYGVNYCEKVLSDAKSTPEEKAVHLSYLIHLIGDMHQPLHCASLFTAEYPKGDKGGNDFYVLAGTKGIKLHAFWDQLSGTSRNMQTHVNYATEIESKYPRKSLSGLKATTPKEWSLEGRQLAIDKAYLKGELKGSTGAANAPALPDGYTKEAKMVAEKQAALAGYRLADEIQKYVR